MGRTLLLPGGARPSNLNLPDSMDAVPIESDLYNICERLKELSPRLHVVYIEGDLERPWTIMEECIDGVSRTVFCCSTLNAEVITRVERIMRIPLETRYAQAEKENELYEKAAAEEEFERLYENMGRPLWTELDKCGFIDSRPVSYPKNPRKQLAGRVTQ